MRAGVLTGDLLVLRPRARQREVSLWGFLGDERNEGPPSERSSSFGKGRLPWSISLGTMRALVRQYTSLPSLGLKQLPYKVPQDLKSLLASIYIGSGQG